MNRPSYLSKEIGSSVILNVHFGWNVDENNVFFSHTHESSLMYIQSEKYIFFFYRSFWFWSLEMQIKIIFMLYMNHSWFEAWRLNSSNQSITFVIRCFIQSLSLSLLNTFRKNSHLIHLAHCHSRVIQQQSSHYFSSSHLQSILHQRLYPSNYQFALQTNRLVPGMANFSAESTLEQEIRALEKRLERGRGLLAM